MALSADRPVVIDALGDENVPPLPPQSIRSRPRRTGFRPTGPSRTGPLNGMRRLSLSAHTSPALHLHLCCAAERARHLEYFHDHVRIEGILFDGTQKPKGGVLYPDLTRPGLGLELKQKDAEKFAV